MTARSKVALAGAIILTAGAAAAIVLLLPRGGAPEANPPTRDAGEPREFVGSASCRECHERFYKLWASSHHGLAMQPFTRELADGKLTEHVQAITVRGRRYRADIAAEQPCVIEGGQGDEKRYPIAHAMGGKNVYYFLTPLERGRLQVLPVAYDVRGKKWIDTAASMVRHVAEEPVDWRDPRLTFNTACFSCHVSQVSNNYDPKTDTYHTTWAEPGINCETCHGPASEHVRAYKAAAGGDEPKDLGLLSYKTLTIEQTNTTCAPCHAKARPTSESFTPGERFFDHYDLVTFEDPDYHPDGRDLGENYTYTSWLMSPCVKSGKLSCIHCHTSSGRYRFKGEKADAACLPCHQQRVDNAAAHHRHPAGKPGSRCVDCHMPTTTFARMTRSDHSMRPPTPAATMQFESPNACNICHTDKDAAWADKLVREWRKRDYQAPVLHWAGLIQAARKRDWSRLQQMLGYLVGERRDDVVAASLLRLLAGCHDARVEPALLKALGDPSPLVRIAAVDGLSTRSGREAHGGLLAATSDDFRVVRVRAAAALASVPRGTLPSKQRQALAEATKEYLTSLKGRLDLWTSHYNLGNYHMSRREHRAALRFFARATELRPDAVMPLVNAAMAHARLGQPRLAEPKLRKAIELEPANAAANFNLGLLLAGKGDPAGAERSLRRALDADPTLAGAAHNLGILVASRDVQQAIRWCRKAWELQRDEPKYAFTLAFYMKRAGDIDAALLVLRDAARREPAYPDIYFLLGELHEAKGDLPAAMAVYRRAAQNERIPPRVRARFTAKLKGLH